jgi:hypothetical protein
MRCALLLLVCVGCGGRDGSVRTSLPWWEPKEPQEEKRTQKPTKESVETSVRRVVETYLTTDHADRWRYVHDGEQWRPKMVAHYASGVRNVLETAKVDSIAKLGPSVYLATTNVRSKGLAVTIKTVARERDGVCLVDWPTSIGWNELPIRTFLASPPVSPMTFRVHAKLSDYYGFDYREKKTSHYSVNMYDHAIEILNGYVSKDSVVGQRI